MAKAKTQFVCQSCGHQASQWHGQCKQCKAWNAYIEEVVQTEVKSKAAAVQQFSQDGEFERLTPLTDVSTLESARLSSGLCELDRVLGGGLVLGELVLLAGDPGIGKSTLTMQWMNLAAVEGDVFYISGEESKGQIRTRAERLGALNKNILLITENNMEVLSNLVKKHLPKLIVLDSIQTVFEPEISSAPGSVSQLRQIAARTMGWAKGLGIATVLIGHVTKGGDVAGPRVLEHMVDAVLYFEGDRNSHYRILRAFKNRFGSTNEVGLFDMTDAGLVEVKNPSQAFLAERPKGVSGSAVTASLEGTRPILVEIQALVSKAVYGQPRRMATGVDFNRLAMILAVLDKRVGLSLGEYDVYINVVGGLKIDEPATDLAIALAVVSAYHDKPLPDDVLLLGEIGLAGELRRIAQCERRLIEGSSMGFTTAIVPKTSALKTVDMRAIGVAQLVDAVSVVWGGGYVK